MLKLIQHDLSSKFSHLIVDLEEIFLLLSILVFFCVYECEGGGRWYFYGDVHVCKPPIIQEGAPMCVNVHVKASWWILNHVSPDFLRKALFLIYSSPIQLDQITSELQGSAYDPLALELQMQTTAPRFFLFLIYLFFTTQYQLFLSSQYPLTQILPHSTFSFSSLPLGVTHICMHIKSLQDQGHPLPLRSDKAVHLGVQDPQEGRQSFRDSPCSSCWRTSMKTNLLICYIYVGGGGGGGQVQPMLALWLVIQSLIAPNGPGQLTLLVFLWNPCPLQVPQSFSQLFHKSPRASMFGCESLYHLFIDC